jgi:hypothetical protein
MHGRVMIEVKVGKGKHKPSDCEGFGPNSSTDFADFTDSK